MKKIGILLIVLGVILIGLSLFFVTQQSLKGDMTLVLASQSMEPTLHKGDVIRIDRNIDVKEIYCATKDAKPAGDIIIFHRPYGPDELIVHRAVEKDYVDGTYTFRTWGDNNLVRDGWTVEECDVVGKLAEVNPPVWEYNFILWLVVLAGGVLILILGIIAIV